MLKKFKYFIYRLKWLLAPYINFKNPLNVDIELSSVCNLKCSFCPQSHDTQSFKKTTMPIETIKYIIKNIEGKVPAIKLNLRGEPTLHHRFKEILKYVKGKFVDIRINTNGVFNKSLILPILTTCDNISVSLNAIDSSRYKEIHGKDKFNIVMENLKTMHLLEPKKVTVSFVIKYHEDKNIYINFMKNNFPNFKYFIREESDRTGNTFTVNPRKYCNHPSRRLTISATGSVYPCCVQWHKLFLIIGNIYKNTISEIWNGTKRKVLISELKNDIINHSSCRNCGSRDAYK